MSKPVTWVLIVSTPRIRAKSAPVPVTEDARRLSRFWVLFDDPGSLRPRSELHARIPSGTDPCQPSSATAPHASPALHPSSLSLVLTAGSGSTVQSCAPEPLWYLVLPRSLLLCCTVALLALLPWHQSPRCASSKICFFTFQWERKMNRSHDALVTGVIPRVDPGFHESCLCCS